MTRINKSAFNVREKLTELGRRFGLKGSELATAETVQEARDLVSAGRKNLIINGDMRIAQRSNSASANNNEYNTLDRWNTWINYGSGTIAMSQASAAPPGFFKSLQYYNNTNATSPNYHFVEQKIEAQNIPQLKMGTSDAEYTTLSFWVRSSRTGTFNVEITDDDGSHHIIKRYTINNAETWEYKTITFPPALNTGVPTYDNTIGLTLAWWIVGGSSYNGTSADGTWQSFSSLRRNYGGNTVFEDPDYWQLTGVQLEVGKNATDFEHRPYYEELALCQRYFWALTNPFNNNHNIIATGHGGSSNRVFAAIACPVAMRDYPDIWNKLVNVQDGGTTSEVTDRLYPNTLNELGGSANIINYGGYPNRTHLSLSITAGSTTNGNGYRVNIKNNSGDDGYLYFDSEL